MRGKDDVEADVARVDRAPGRSAQREWTTPRGCALRTERTRLVPGAGERFAGYGVMGLPFAGGDVLAFRRFAASSIGPAYASIWHRDRTGAWTFYVTIDPALSCPRYFGTAVDRIVVTAIEATWIGHDHLVVSAPGPRVEWSMRVRPTLATRVIGALGGLAPRRAWSSERVLGLAGAAAGLGLGAGPMRLSGAAPNGQRFRIRPRRLWRIDASAAQVEGRELGPIGGGGGVSLGDFRLPAVGILACGDAVFDHPVAPSPGEWEVGRIERL